MATTLFTSARNFTASTAAMTYITPVQYLGDKIYLLDPNTNPATVFFRKAKKRVVGDLTYKWQDDVIVPEWAVLVSSGTSNTVWTFTTPEGYYFAPWDILLNKNTGAVVQVTIAASATQLTVWPAVTGTTYSTNSSAGDIILKLGNAMEEGIGIPVSRTTQETTITNYIQRFSFPLRTSYPAKNAAYHYKGTDYDYQMKKKMLEMTLSQDKAFLLNGAPNLVASDSATTEPDDGANKVGITMGLRYVIATYADAALNRTEVDLTESEFYEWVKDAFVYGSSKKMLFASPLLIQAIMMWNLGRGKFEMKGSESIPGFNFASITTPHGELTVVNHKGLRALSSGDKSWNFIVDMENVGYVYFKGLDTQIWRDVVKDGSHQYVDEIGCYCGTEYRLPNTHAALNFVSFS